MNKIIIANSTNSTSTIDKIKKNFNNLRLLYVRYKILKINNIWDIVNIFKLINYYHNYSCTTDIILDFLIKSISLYKLSDIELQKISLLQQEYKNEYNLFGYASLTLWLAIIESFNYK